MAEITNKKDNILFARQELEISTKAQTTPSKADAMKIATELSKKTEDLIVINKIKGNFGTKTYTIFADVYNSLEDKEKNQIKKKVKREKK